jgi:outer membrane lipoprotein LolB
MRFLNARKPSLAQFGFAAMCGVVIGLAGCASAPNKSIAAGGDQANSTALSVLEAKRVQHQASLALIREFTLDGRIGVQADGRGFSGKMRWQHLSQFDAIDLYSPLGSKVVAIESNADAVTLTSSDGNTLTSSDVESLTEQTMGWRLPAHYLEDWALGRATAAPIASATWDGEGKLSKLSQDGWEIQYISYKASNGYQLPSKLNLRNAKLYLKLVIDNWQLSDSATSAVSKTTKP